MLAKAQMAIFIDERTLRDLSKVIEADADELDQDSEEEFEVDSDEEAGKHLCRSIKIMFAHYYL